MEKENQFFLGAVPHPPTSPSRTDVRTAQMFVPTEFQKKLK